MKLLPFAIALIALLRFAGPATGQHIRGGVMAGTSHPASASSLGTGFGVDGWIGLEFLALPVVPRIALAVDRFSGEQQSRLELKSARVDVLGILRDVPLAPFGFVGAGIGSTDFRSSSDELPVGVIDAGAVLSAGIGVRQALGPVRMTFEARYLTVPDAHLNVMQLRLGFGL